MTYLSPEKEAALTQLEELILRNYGDVAFQTETVARRRRREWPSMEGIPQDIMLGKKTSNPPAAAKTEAMALIKADSEVCNKDFPDLCDSGIIECVFFSRTPDYEHALRILYWRGRQMSAIWDLFCILCQRGFLSMKSLIQPMRFNPLTPDVMGVMFILGCFEYTSTEYRLTTFPQDKIFETPLIWLATVIVRSCIEPDKLFELIEYTGILGKLNMAKLIRHHDSILQDTKFGHDPHAMEGTSQAVFGFWLPHGIGEDQTKWPGIIRGKVKLFNHSERVFKNYFRIPDDKIITEEMQDQYFRQRSHLEPGYRYSGQLKK